MRIGKRTLPIYKASKRAYGILNGAEEKRKSPYGDEVPLRYNLLWHLQLLWEKCKQQSVILSYLKGNKGIN